MPLTIKTGSLKYKKNNGEYVGIGAIGLGDIETEVDDWLSENLDPITANPPLDRNLSLANAAAPADLVGNLKNEIDNKPDVFGSDAEDVDLDITDSDGNVIMRLEDGHIKTKEFDSSQIPYPVESVNGKTGVAVLDADDVGAIAEPESEGTAGQVLVTDGEGGRSWETINPDISDAAIIKNDDEEGIDLDVSDSDGNVLVRFLDGEVQTKKFNSDNSVYSKTFSYTNASGTQTITHFFPSGNMLLFHLAVNAAGSNSIANLKVTYSYVDQEGVSHTIGQEYGYNYLRYILPENAVSVSVAYGTDMAWGDSATLVFTVISEASFERKTTIVTLDANGGKDYSTLRSAIDDIKMKASTATPYEIHIYPGTYNVMSDYSADEISASGFIGPLITNGISLIGIGQREQIILSGEIDSGTYSAQKRNDMSTLNISGNVRIENLTIKAKNIRYAIHDDLATLKYIVSDVHIYKNLKLHGTNLTTGEITFGAGGAGNRKLIVSDCEFNGAYTTHNSANNVCPFQVYIENCSATTFSFTDYDAVTPTYVWLRNCKAMFITIGTTGGDHDQSLFINGEGTTGAYIYCRPGYVYNTGDCRTINGVAIQSGYAVKATRTTYHSTLPHAAIATDLDSIYGISIGNDGTDTIVQVSGYINSNTLGISGLSVGDYLTIDENGAVVSGGTVSNAIAKVTYVNELNVAFAKLLF